MYVYIIRFRCLDFQDSDKLISNWFEFLTSVQLSGKLWISWSTWRTWQARHKRQTRVLSPEMARILLHPSSSHWINLVCKKNVCCECVLSDWFACVVRWGTRTSFLHHRYWFNSGHLHLIRWSFHQSAAFDATTQVVLTVMLPTLGWMAWLWRGTRMTTDTTQLPVASYDPGGSTSCDSNGAWCHWQAPMLVFVECLAD